MTKINDKRRWDLVLKQLSDELTLEEEQELQILQMEAISKTKLNGGIRKLKFNEMEMEEYQNKGNCHAWLHT